MNRLEEIKKSVNEIENLHPEDRWEVLMGDVIVLVAAVEAVLKLHKPRVNPTGFFDPLCDYCTGEYENGWPTNHSSVQRLRRSQIGWRASTGHTQHRPSSRPRVTKQMQRSKRKMKLGKHTRHRTRR